MQHWLVYIWLLPRLQSKFSAIVMVGPPLGVHIQWQDLTNVIGGEKVARPRSPNTINKTLNLGGGVCGTGVPDRKKNDMEPSGIVCGWGNRTAPVYLSWSSLQMIAGLLFLVFLCQSVCTLFCVMLCVEGQDRRPVGRPYLSSPCLCVCFLFFPAFVPCFCDHRRLTIWTGTNASNNNNNNNNNNTPFD